MGRILGIDFGEKRTGLAATDPLGIAVHAIGTFPTTDIPEFITVYLQSEEVDCIVVGDPRADNMGNPKFLNLYEEFIQNLNHLFPEMKIHFQDEHFTSQRAREVIRMTVKSKKKRRDKSIVDKISAVLILQDYLNHI